MPSVQHGTVQPVHIYASMGWALCDCRADGTACSRVERFRASDITLDRRLTTLPIYIITGPPTHSVGRGQTSDARWHLSSYVVCRRL